MFDKVLNYFQNDTMASDVWKDKYCMKDKNGNAVEETPTDMHWRLAKEFARIEYGYIKIETEKAFTTGEEQFLSNLSSFGKQLYTKRRGQIKQNIEQEFFNYFSKFDQIVPQGSIMSNLGNFFVFGSLSNCFGIASPYDSYGGIIRTDEHIAQLEKRRGGVGVNISTLRHTAALVSNTAKSSTGVPSFSERYSNTTREVAQDGRRGALMILLLCVHPDIFRFASMKDDRTKVTGANVSVMFTEEFMQALEKGEDFYCRFPVDYNIGQAVKCKTLTPEYNKIYNFGKTSTNEGTSLYFGELGEVSVMRIKPQELFDLVAEMAWKNAEPGVAYYDRVIDYSPEGVYEQYKAKVCNPCGEQWFAFNETCRLIALNFWGIVKNHFETGAEIDYDLLYEFAYMQQRLGDNLVDLECEYIDRIIDKIKSDPEPEEVKRVELELWIDIQRIAREGRRTGGGFTALGDMLAALNLKYDSDEAIATVEKVMKTKMRAELDCTIDMAILRGPFVGWDKDLEFDFINENGGKFIFDGKNSFFDMLRYEFPEQAARMAAFGRRNTNWSTVAPTGTVSLMCQSTSGLEPLFKAYYIRRKKINPGQEGVRIDFTDQNGDTWQEYAILHPKFLTWIKTQKGFDIKGEYVTGSEASYNVQHNKLMLEFIFKLSPYYKSEADDISWEKRIEMQAIIQKYTSNAISSTINLPKDVSQQVVKDIYLAAYHAGLKGVTVYRDGSRSGVLISETEKAPKDEFGYTDAIKRPKELDAHYYPVTIKGTLFAVIIGMLDGIPYELFALENPLKNSEIKGKLVKMKKGHYSFLSSHYIIENVQLTSDKTDEKLLTRMCSQLLRHGVNPKHIIEQVEKSEVTIVSFAKAIVRVLKKYIPDEEVLGEVCKQCGKATIVREEGCLKCVSCGSSKC
jgi:ribonucleoside-diphosphate reductase alpha chain